MAMKGWQGLVLASCVMVSGCSVWKEAFYQPELNTVSQAYKPVNTWQFQAAKAVVVNTHGRTIVLQQAQDASVHVQTQHNLPFYKMTGVIKEGVLTLEVHSPDTFSTDPTPVTVSLPLTVHSLTINKGNVQGMQTPSGLRQLSLQGNQRVVLATTRLDLQQLTIDHVQQAQLNGLACQHLNLSVAQSGSVQLNGMVGLDSVRITQSGIVSIVWVNSQQVKVELDDKSRAFLAGSAELLIGNVHDQARLNAQYVRSQKAFIHTYKQAVAQVTVLDSLNAYAEGTSSIYYYQQPKLVGRYYHDQGSILYRGEKAPPCLEPECQRMPHPLPG